MTVIWIIVEVLFIFMFYQLPPVKEEMVPADGVQSSKQRNTTQSDQPHSGSLTANVQIEGSISSGSASEVTKSTKDMFKNSQSVQVQGSNQSERSPLLPRFSVNGPTSTSSNNPRTHEEAVTVQSDAIKPSLCWRIRKAFSHLMWMTSELLREEMVVLLAILFITMFSQTTAEVCVIIMKVQWEYLISNL